jgi:hypothetical protein
MALADILRVLTLSSDPKVSCDEVNDLVEVHLIRVRAKLAALGRLERQLASLRAQCDSGHEVARVSARPVRPHCGDKTDPQTQSAAR